MGRIYINKYSHWHLIFSLLLLLLSLLLCSDVSLERSKSLIRIFHIAKRTKHQQKNYPTNKIKQHIRATIHTTQRRGNGALSHPSPAWTLPTPRPQLGSVGRSEGLAGVVWGGLLMAGTFWCLLRWATLNSASTPMKIVGGSSNGRKKTSPRIC